jgi:hypothetical protein
MTSTMVDSESGGSSDRPVTKLPLSFLVNVDFLR